MGWVYAGRVTPRAVAASKRFIEIARARGYEPAQLALLWVKEQPGVTAPIVGPRTQEHLRVALDVLDMRLDEETAVALDEIVPPGSAVANFHNTSGWMRMSV